MSTIHKSEPTEGRKRTPEEDVWVSAQQSPDFIELRRRFRHFAFPLTAAFLAWYVGYLLLTAFARGFLETTVIGNINLGFFLGLAQFITTFLIAVAYERHSTKVLDPLSATVKADVEIKLRAVKQASL